MSESIKTWSTVTVQRPLEPVFQFVGPEFFRNYPRWSPEVERLEKLSAGPMAAGVIGRQVRTDSGRRSESTFRVEVFEPGRRIEFASLDKPWYRAAYTFEGLDAATRVDFSFELTPGRRYWLFHTLIHEVMSTGSRSLILRLKGLLEAEIRPPGPPV